MSFIWSEIGEFIKIWNAYYIYIQSGLLNSVGGILDRLYYYPKEGIENYKKIPNLDYL